MHLRIITVMSLAACVGGCVTNSGPGSVMGGECRLVAAPEYAVLGKTPYDQRWVNVTTESIVSGCGQPRPKARPASLDARPAPVVSGVERRRPFGHAASQPVPATFQPGLVPTQNIGVVRPRKTTFRERVRKWLHMKPRQ